MSVISLVSGSSTTYVYTTSGWVSIQCLNSAVVKRGASAKRVRYSLSFWQQTWLGSG